MKKIVALILALLMVFTFTACGQTDDNEETVKAIKEALMEKVQDVMWDVSIKEGREEDDVRKAIDNVTVEYTDENINDGGYTATATYCLTFNDGSNISYYYVFRITGHLETGEASMVFLNSYSE